MQAWYRRAPVTIHTAVDATMDKVQNPTLHKSQTPWTKVKNTLNQGQNSKHLFHAACKFLPQKAKTISHLLAVSTDTGEGYALANLANPRPSLAGSHEQGRSTCPVPWAGHREP
eukprot:239059-Chlamydomonas_euryale.AAC.1